jgi:hypothetical protein
MTPLIAKGFGKENICLKDKHLSRREHLREPILCLKGCSDTYVIMTQI